jgi:hypothetical protein
MRAADAMDAHVSSGETSQKRVQSGARPLCVGRELPPPGMVGAGSVRVVGVLGVATQ